MTNGVKRDEVIGLIEQFLSENSLLRTLRCLQEETNLVLNTVDSAENFMLNIQLGQWDVVMRMVQTMRFPDEKLIDLYEQMLLERIELRELDAAGSMLRTTYPMMMMKQVLPQRYMHLESLIAKPYFDHGEAYPNGTSKEQRRALIASALATDVTVMQPSKLVSLLNEAIKNRHDCHAFGECYSKKKGILQQRKTKVSSEVFIDSKPMKSDEIKRLYKKPRTKAERLLTQKQKHPLRMSCGDACRRRCKTHFSDTDRMRIHEDFWSMNFDAQKLWLLSKISREPVQRKRAVTFEGTSRSCSLIYRLHTNSGEEVQVCQTFFLRTLGYNSNSIIVELLKHVGNTGGKNNVYTDMRGRHTPGNKKDHSLIIKHIEKYNPHMPLCKEEIDSGKRYISSETSIKSMYEDFLKEHPDYCTYTTYHTVLKRANITLGGEPKDNNSIALIQKRKKRKQSKVSSSINEVRDDDITCERLLHHKTAKSNDIMQSEQTSVEDHSITDWMAEHNRSYNPPHLAHPPLPPAANMTQMEAWGAAHTTPHVRPPYNNDQSNTWGTTTCLSFSHS